MQQIDKSENQETATDGMQSVQMHKNGGNVSHEKTMGEMMNAVSYMNRLIVADGGYHAALWRVSQTYPQFSTDELAAAYEYFGDEKF